MRIQFVLLPLFVEVVLTFVLLSWMAILRQQDFRRGVRKDQVALREPNWSVRTLQVGYCFANQFELPMLFYVLTILSIITHHADIVFLVLAWIFVLSRIAHAVVHTTSNNIMQRGPLFGLGMVVLLIMWIVFIVRILIGLP
jgi:hypothetical protein